MFKVGQKVEIVSNDLYGLLMPEFAIGDVGTVTSLNNGNGTVMVDTSNGELQEHEIKRPLFHLAFPINCLKPAKVN